MAGFDTTVLAEFIATYPHPDVIASLSERLAEYPAGIEPAPSAETWLSLYETATDRLEAWMWREDFPPPLLDLQQRLYREMESGLAHHEGVPRHAFTLVIPVADRPQQLHHALSSLLILSRRFAYAAPDGADTRRLRVLVADDSRDETRQQEIRHLSEQFDQAGLATEYFGPREQYRLLETRLGETPGELHGMFAPMDPHSFTHKGASTTRNLCYLKLSDWLRETPYRLVWFFDSDQAFCIPRRGDGEDCYPIHFLHQIDRIFRNRETAVLTGKVVGDPPVSPAVMGGNFLQDVGAFLDQIAALDPQGRCQFHAAPAFQTHDAAYHDMADLFGFQQTREVFRYTCTLPGEHDHQACLMDFVARLPGFFDGVHPTRQTHYVHESLSKGIKAARTVYTGNYVINAQALDYFIPFASLGLRMAGPVLGRILQAELGPRFISANLPLLHRRALPEQGRAEFRSGVGQQAQRIDLSGEFIRQYYGDVMLFTIETLAKDGYPGKSVSDAQIESLLHDTEAAMRARYQTKQQQISTRIEDFQHWLDTHRESPAIAPAQHALQALIEDMRHNFTHGAAAYQQLDSDTHRARQLQAIHRAIRDYPGHRSRWNNLLEQPGPQAAEDPQR
ncbi:MAG: hypothetical protein ABW101_06520 [Candidatus Thiodiazotropha sp.]